MRKGSTKPRGNQAGSMSRRWLLLLLLLPLSLAPAAEARWEELDEAAMDQVSAEAGLSIEFTTLGYRSTTESLRLTDTDTGNALELQDLVIHDGTGNPCTLRTAGQAITVDVFAADDPADPTRDREIVSIRLPLMEQVKSLTVGRIVFCGRETGSLHIGNIAVPESHLYLSGHGGVDMELGFASTIDRLDYTYNEAAPLPERLSLGGLRLAEDFTANPADDPADPGTWSPAGTFRVGDMASGRPATLDIFGDEAGGRGILSLNLPARGSFRVENVQFGPSSFGPCAIDGIRVHRLSLQLPAN